MEAVQNEVINNLRATFKETDLFKVYQVPQATAPPDFPNSPSDIQ